MLAYYLVAEARGESISCVVSVDCDRLTTVWNRKRCGLEEREEG